MAGDWIKMRVDLHTDPKVVRIACAVCAHGVRGEASKSAQRCAVVGALHLVWCLFDTHSVDGQLEGYTPEVVDELVGISGFAAAMASVGWLDSTPKGLTMHNFQRHNGQGAKRRAMHADRVRETRACASQAHTERTESAPEKRREEESRGEEEPAPEPVSQNSSTSLTGAQRSEIRQGLIRIGVESGAAQEVSLHPQLTLALVTSTLAAVKRDKTIKSQAAVVLTRLRRELEMAE